ncbi:MAG: hypothetical protein M1839_003214 [Geoglossum umbratile]|nr:MAG: hypothetical protein M1839_003214 [Geoglossum umbratile]
MRLLRLEVDGEFSLTDFVGGDTIPPYAILSHTWGLDGEEVTFKDLVDGTGHDKTGYKKIRFCGDQARHDDLQYFWVDTCCIDKSKPAELQEAINSMFRWYHNATRCYVYLSDVLTAEQKEDDWLTKFAWKSAFQTSRWFTRGWTLQELLAPVSVEFFSYEGKRLGDKISLQQQICEITGVPRSALQGAHLSQFSDKARFSWIQCRQTKVEEDKAYSLLGIFDVEMPLRYGEGSASAFKRLEKEIDKLNKCLQDFHLTDPSYDKKRIEDTKGGLLKDSYCWILNNPEFQRWRNDQQSQLLWIKGNPGKGKTMLLCGIVNELEESIARTALLSYFFCQATDSRINNATAVLRGLMYLLFIQQPSLVSYIRKKHDHTGKTLFEDTNAWVALSEIFTNILKDPSLNSTYLIVDALDECVKDLPKLLNFIIHSSVSFRVKWIVSSRNWPYIEERLKNAGQNLSLELNAESVSTAVKFFIQHKVLQLAERKSYNDRTREAVLSHLYLHANDTFLWVALVCQNLEETPLRNTLAKLNTYPPGLNSFYERMMQQIRNLDDADDADLCKRILALIAIVYQPITLKELTSLTEMLEDMTDDLESLREVISLCGSFLTIRQDIIYFVHQSAKDFLFTKASNEIYPSGIEKAHYIAFSRSLQVMIDLQDVNDFIRKKYLYWLEALSLCKSMSDGVVSMAKLEALLQSRQDLAALLDLVHDARRFIMYFKQAIEQSPLQAYTSTLIFSPACSLIRKLFEKEEPKWIATKPAVGDNWNACLQTLEGHSNSVLSVAFSPDSTRLASASGDYTVKIWDASSGECLQTLKGHSDWVQSVAFSPDSTWLASASSDYTVKIWDASSGECLQTLSIAKTLFNISIDTSGLYLHTEIGTIAIDISTTSTPSIKDAQSSQRKGWGLSSDGIWITYDSENLVWLPSEYRPSCSAVSGNTIGIGVGSGRVWICNFNVNNPYHSLEGYV